MHMQRALAFLLMQRKARHMDHGRENALVHKVWLFAALWHGLRGDTTLAVIHHAELASLPLTLGTRLGFTL